MRLTIFSNYERNGLNGNKCVCTSIETKCGLSDLENNSVRLQHSHKELGKSLNKKMQEKNRNHINAKN